MIQAPGLLPSCCSAVHWAHGLQLMISESGWTDTLFQRTNLKVTCIISFHSKIKRITYVATPGLKVLRNVDPGQPLISINSYMLRKGNHKFLLDNQPSLQHLGYQLHLI